MVTKPSVNEQRVYYNFEGRMPPVRLEAGPAPLPLGDTEPRLLTDTTLRDGAQDARFALFPNEARLRYELETVAYILLLTSRYPRLAPE